jgi:hypothetical protein
MEYLPTERRLCIARIGADRDETCKLCGSASESNLHAFGECTHPGVRARQSKSIGDGARVAQLLDPSGRPPTIWVPSWFDTMHTQNVLVPADTSGEVLKAITDHPRMAGFLGVLPPHVDSLISRKDDTLHSLQERAACLSLTMVRGALATWLIRVQAMNQLLNGVNGAAYMDNMTHAWATKKRKADIARSDRDAEKYAEKRPKIVGPALVSGRYNMRSTFERAWGANSASRPATEASDRSSTQTVEELRREGRIDMRNKRKLCFPCF